MIALALLLACVPRREYDALAVELKAAQAGAAAAAVDHDARARTLEAEVARLPQQARVLQARIDDLQLESEARRRMIASLNAEKAALVKDRSALRASIAEMEAALRELDARRAEAKARVAEDRALAEGLALLVDAGRARVEVENAWVRVVLVAVLAEGEGTELSAEGRETVGAVARALAGSPERRLLVEVTRPSAAGWERAAARAITVARALVAAGLPAERVGAAVRPGADDRRVDVVVEPDRRRLPGVEELEAAAGP